MNMSTDGATSSESYGALDAERPVAVVSWTWRDTAECARRRVMSFLQYLFPPATCTIDALSSCHCGSSWWFICLFYPSQ